MFPTTPLSKDPIVLFAHAGQQMLDALEGMHRLGFIHRDVKPANFVMFPQWCSNLGSDEGKQDSAGKAKLPQAMLPSLLLSCEKHCKELHVTHLHSG